MFAVLRRAFRKLPSLSPRFHIAFGLCALLTTVVMLAYMLGVLPQRSVVQERSHRAQAESIAASVSILLQQDNGNKTIGSYLNFLIERNLSLRAIDLESTADGSIVRFGRG